MTELGTIDRETGAPATVRAVVGGLSKPKDRLATLGQFYKTVMPDPDDPNNFLFLNPKTGKLTAYNPTGLDLGDVASMTREGTQMAGSIAGATAGAPLGIPGIAGGSMLGAAAGEELFGLVLKGLGVQDTRTTAEHMGETVYAGATGLGGPAGGVTQAGLAAGTKAAIRGASGAGVQRIIDDAARFGFDPSFATATANKTVDMLETFVSRTPGGFGVMKKSVDKTLRAIRSSVDDLAIRLEGAPTDAVKVGRTIREGIEGSSGFVSRFNTRAGQLYDKVNIIAPVDVSNTRAMLNELMADIPDAPALSNALRNKALAKIDEAFQIDVSDFGTMPFAAIKKLRTIVGQKIANASLVDEIPKSEWKRLYGALSEDMKAAADAAGPEAKEAFSRASKFWKAGTQRIDDFLEPLIKGKTPELIADAVRIGGDQGPTKIRAIRRSLTPEQWKIVAGDYLVNMTKPRPGQMVEEATGFSFESFLTNWNKLAPATRDALFDNMGGLREGVDALVRLAKSVRQSGQAFANPSGTASGLIGQTMLFGSAGSVGAGLASGSVATTLMFPAIVTFASMSANGMARLFTNPTFVKWLAASAKIKPNGIGAHVGRLAQIAASGDLDIKQAVLEYSDKLLGGVEARPIADPEEAK